MKGQILITGTLFFGLAISANAQHHVSNWVYQNATDTTIVPCWTDSLNAIGIPPSSMGMMMPSSMYMRIERMPMDSLILAHDSTFMGWCRIRAGSDSLHFNFMNEGGMMGGSGMMQFGRSLACRFHWDSLAADSMHRHWRVTGMKGWNGTSWNAINGLSIASSVVSFTSTSAFSAVAFTGTSAVTSIESVREVPAQFRLLQNYPNPFNPTTTIAFSVPRNGFVRLDVFNILGERIATPVNGQLGAGGHRITFDASAFPSGVYIYRLQNGGVALTGKMTLTK